MDIIQDTPTELIKLKDLPVYVKREDLACPPPGPPFAKVRGLYPRLLSLKQKGITTVGYMDTSVSMATWGISYFAQKLGMKSVVFYPKYKDGLKCEQEKQIEKWKKFHAEVICIEKPNRLKINYYRAKKILLERFPHSEMLEQGLPFSETITQVTRQVSLLPKESLGGTIVMCVGSGVMTAGVLKGLSLMLNKNQSQTVIGIIVAPKNLEMKKKDIIKKSGLIIGQGFFSINNIKLELIDIGYEYEQTEEIECPFPCNKYYDRKAWKWLCDHLINLTPPIVFWNIGGDYIL
jgi:1-aminocyclopropane-1-carboxylate deaminase/D-cysteine desulfhydrase-like pyridoxal-dependent ACC family enzyme